VRRSIRWALIGWFGLVLVAVVGTFGGLLYGQARSATLEGVDAGLHDRAHAIAAALEYDDVDGWEVELSDDYLRGLAADGAFRVWAPDGAVLREGGEGARDGAAPALGLWTREDRRELVLAGPEGTRILVGRSVAAEEDRLARLLALVVGAGLAVVALGLAGGAWLARRSLVPVGSMAATAASIDERDLSKRLDEGACPRELRGLARAFNRALDRLEAAFLRQAQFTADASHELRTPVAVLRTQAEQALRGERTAKEYRATLEACVRAAERMTGLVESLLSLARADEAGSRSSSGAFALDGLVRETAEQLRPLAEAEGVEICCAGEPVEVRGDARLLGEALSNLVGNGVRYNRRGGAVEVSVSRENGEAVIRVRDTGVGIPAGALPHIFERFYRVDPARSRGRGGSGLGLAIARRIVEAHEGSIEVESRPGEGSTFTVRLPATPG
jgi:heavy metal sensor kinase